MIDVPPDLMRLSLIPFGEWLVRYGPRDGNVGRLRRYVFDCRAAGHAPAAAATVTGLQRHGSARHRPAGEAFTAALDEAAQLYAAAVATARASIAFHEAGHAIVAGGCDTGITTPYAGP